MTQEHTLAEEEQMTAARTKQHEEEKHTGIMTEKTKKRRKQDKKQENRTQAVDSNKASRLCYKADSNKASRLCYKAEPGTLSPGLPSSSCSRRQRYQVSLPLSVPPPLHEYISQKQTKLLGFGGCT